MDYQQVRAQIDSIRGLPTLSPIFVTLSQALEDENVTSEKVAGIVEYDQALTAKLLRLVNSSFFGFYRQIKTVTHAVTILGICTVRNIALSISVIDTMKKRCRSDGFDEVGFWQHSIGTGIISEILGQRTGFTESRDPFVAGLLHDIGKLVIHQYLGEEFSKIVAQVQQKGLSMRDAEQEVLGFTHAEVGQYLAERWNLLPAFEEVIGGHHQPLGQYQNWRAVSIVHLADALCRRLGLGNGGDPFVPIPEPSVWDRLEITPESVERGLLDMPAEIKRVEEFLHLVGE